jgi:hypothetical protein
MRGPGIVVILLADRIHLGQLLVAFRERQSGAFAATALVVGDLIRRRVDLVELLPLLHIAAFEEQPFQDDAVDLRSHVGVTNAGHSSRKLGGDRHRPSVHGDDGDLRRGWRRAPLPTAAERHPRCVLACPPRRDKRVMSQMG